MAKSKLNKRQKDWLAIHAAGESKLSDSLAGFFTSQGKRVVESLGDDFTLSNLKKQFDAKAETKELKKIVGPTIDDMLRIGAGRVLREFANNSPSAGPKRKKAIDIENAGDFKLSKAVLAAIDDAFDDLMGQSYWQLIQGTTSDLITDVLKQGIEDGLSIPNLRQALLHSFAGMSRVRAESIARTETTLAFNSGHEASYNSLHADGMIWGREWLSIIDDDTRTSHVNADNQKKKIGVQFTVGSSKCDYPGDASLPAKERVRCRCTTAVIVDEPKG